MKNFCIYFTLLLFLFSCKGKGDKTTSTNTLIDNDFTKQFSPLELKFTIADTSLDKNNSKPLKIFGKKYFPDSLIYKYFEQGSKIQYYPIGKAQNDTSEIYVVLKATSGERKAAYILCYDNALNYKDGAMICQTDGDKKTSYLSTLDKSFNIMIRRTDIMPGQEPNLTEIFLGYNNTGKFGQLVTNDTDEEIALQNPIDSIKQTRKFTGDYYLDNKNLISLRDGKDSGELVFFYHYEKDKQECVGEIKDKVKMTGNSAAAYIKEGDPCVINLKFTGTTIIVTEESGCGNKKTTLECTLNGTFVKATKKNTTKIKPANDISPLGAKPAQSSNTTVPIDADSKTKTTNSTKTNTATKPTIKKVEKPIVKPEPVKKPVIKQPEIQ